MVPTVNLAELSRFGSLNPEQPNYLAVAISVQVHLLFFLSRISRVLWCSVLGKRAWCTDCVIELSPLLGVPFAMKTIPRRGQTQV